MVTERRVPVTQPQLSNFAALSYEPGERVLASGASSLEFFRAHQAIGTSVPTYLIESTAPDNVDDTAKIASKLHPKLAPIDSDLAVKQIAEALVTGAEPNLVVMVHGFNCPQHIVLQLYGEAVTAIARDAAIASRQGLVCVGYRWPSEAIGAPARATWSALPTLPLWALFFGIAVVLFSLPLFYLASRSRQGWIDSLVWHPAGIHIITMFGWTIAGLVCSSRRAMERFQAAPRAES